MLNQQDFNPRLATTFSFIPDKSFVGIGSTGAKQTSKGLFICLEAPIPKGSLETSILFLVQSSFFIPNSIGRLRGDE